MRNQRFIVKAPFHTARAARRRRWRSKLRKCRKPYGKSTPRYLRAQHISLIIDTYKCILTHAADVNTPANPEIPKDLRACLVAGTRAALRQKEPACYRDSAPLIRVGPRRKARDFFRLIKGKLNWLWRARPEGTGSEDNIRRRQLMPGPQGGGDGVIRTVEGPRPLQY
jgi:hypothetical protein